MRRYRVTGISVPKHPVLLLTFDDGLTGELNLGPDLERGPVFEPLKDEAYFRTVAIADDGRSFGWRLDQIGAEIDFSADAARTDIETTLVLERAARYRARGQHAAE